MHQAISILSAWLCFHCIGPVSNKYITFTANDIKKYDYILKANTRLFNRFNMQYVFTSFSSIIQSIFYAFNSNLPFRLFGSNFMSKLHCLLCTILVVTILNKAIMEMLFEIYQCSLDQSQSIPSQLTCLTKIKLISFYRILLKMMLTLHTIKLTSWIIHFEWKF